MNTDYQDKELVCALCNERFIFTSGEQSFLNDLKDKGKISFVVQPKRCPACRQKRREEKATQEFNSGYPVE